MELVSIHVTCQQETIGPMCFSNTVKYVYLFICLVIRDLLNFLDVFFRKLDPDNYDNSDMVWTHHNSRKTYHSLTWSWVAPIKEWLKSNQSGQISVFELEIIHQQVNLIWMRLGNHSLIQVNKFNSVCYVATVYYFGNYHNRKLQRKLQRK